MKIAFFKTGAKYNNPNSKLRCMFCEALSLHNVENIGYAATNLDKPFILPHIDGKTYTMVLPCSIPLLSKLARWTKGGLLRKFIFALEKLMYTIRVIRRLPQDKVDVYIILHLWSFEIPFLNLILRIFRPTIIMWFGGSFRWYEQTSRWKHYIFTLVYRFSLRLASLTLVSLDLEQKHYLFKVLKLPRNKVANFKEYIVDDKLFRKLDKNESAKKVGFDRNEINIVMVSRIENPQRISSCKDYEKDPFTALEIFRYLTEKYPKVKLHVFGRGVGMDEFKKRIHQYNLEDKVKIYEWVPRELLPEYYAAADLTFFPFPFITVNDGQANHESLLCGTPVIYFKRYPWVKTEQLGGFLIDRDPMIGAQQILSRLNPAYLLKKMKEAESIPHDFNIEAFGDSLTKILKQLKTNRNKTLKIKGKI
jgi:glycosyltransferase involved in cell wall biosynthesis